MKVPATALETLDQRSRSIFRAIVEAYLDSGEPLGSRTLSRNMVTGLSPATIRNVMSDLEMLGLIYAPHTSAGRLPTQSGLRFFIDSFLEVGNLSREERASIETRVKTVADGRTMDNVLQEASQMLSGLSSSAGLVLAPKADLRLKHIEFIRLEPTKALVVIVGENGSVENRIIDLPPGITASALGEAANFLNARVGGMNLSQARAEITGLRDAIRGELDELAGRLVEQGVAIWGGTSEADPGRLIVSGHGNLIGNLSATEDLDAIRLLFDELEAKEGLMRLLDLTEQGEGVRIFIGSENKLFSLSGSSLVIAPYGDSEQRVVGALGIIGPTRLNYSRIVPLVDYTAQVVSRLLRQ